MDDGRRMVMLGGAPVEAQDGSSAPLARGAGPARSRVAPPSTGTDTAPPFTVPGMVLLAALSIFEGYRWLRIIPGGSLRPSGLFFAVAVVPATWWLTRNPVGRRAVVLRRLALAAACSMPALGVLVLAGVGPAAHRGLGAASLLLAVTMLALAGTSERGERSASTR